MVILSIFRLELEEECVRDSVWFGYYGVGFFLYNFDWKLPESVGAEDLDITESSGLAPARKQNLFVVATPYG